jgi:hypothetical protein
MSDSFELDTWQSNDQREVSSPVPGSGTGTGWKDPTVTATNGDPTRIPWSHAFK